MSAVYLLRKIISKNAVICLNQDRKSVDLSENETAFKIGGLPTESIAIKADKFPAPIGLTTPERTREPTLSSFLKL